MSLLIAVETGNRTHILAGYAGSDVSGVGGIDIGGGGRSGVFPVPLVLETLSPLLPLPSFLVGGLAILGLRGMWLEEFGGLS